VASNTKQMTDEEATAAAVAASPSITAGPKSFDEALGGEPDAGYGDEVETALARPEEYTSTADMAAFTDSPELGADEVSLPRLRLGQALTPEVQAGTATQGQWILLGEDPMDNPIVIPLLMKRDYQHFDSEGFVELTCTNDRCPLREWGEDPKTGRRVGPACTRVYRYITYVTDTGSLAELQFKKSGEEVARFINTFVGTKGMGRFALKLGYRMKNSPRGPYPFPMVKLAVATAEDYDTARAAVTGAA
jgi:hypothetical protein